MEELDWNSITDELHQNRYAILPNFLADQDYEGLKIYYYKADLFRKTVVMERYRFGLGEYKYFDYPLPEKIQQIRTTLYPHLAPIANTWFRALKIG